MYDPLDNSFYRLRNPVDRNVALRRYVAQNDNKKHDVEVYPAPSWVLSSACVLVGLELIAIATWLYL